MSAKKNANLSLVLPSEQRTDVFLNEAGGVSISQWDEDTRDTVCIALYCTKRIRAIAKHLEMLADGIDSGELALADDTGASDAE